MSLITTLFVTPNKKSGSQKLWFTPKSFFTNKKDNKKIANKNLEFDENPVITETFKVLSEKWDEKSGTMEQLASKCDSLYKQNQNLNKIILDLTQERNDLKETIAENERQLEVECNELQNVSQMNEELQNQTKALNEEMKQKIIEWKTKCTDLETKVEELTTKCDSTSEQNQSLAKEILELKEQKELTHKQIEFLEKNLSEEKQKLDSTKKQANEELQEMHSVVDKSFNNLKEKNSFLTQSLSEEKEKSIRLENELKNVKHIQSQQMDNIHNECVKTISDLRTRLTTEEMSFEFERKNKERYANENQSYLKKIQTLENEVKRLNDLINKPIEDSGNQLIMAAEEGEFKNPKNLIALINNECSLDDSLVDDQRLSILQKRNTMVLPHLRTSYAVELPFMKENVSPEKIRQGLTVKDSNVFVKPSTDEHQSRRYSKSFRKRNLSQINK